MRPKTQTNNWFNNRNFDTSKLKNTTWCLGNLKDAFRANGNKYEWEWKEGHTEWRWTRTWANWKSVEWAFVKTDGTEYGLATPAKFIDNSGEYEVIRDNELLKVTSEWEYKDRYIDPNNWDFVDAPSSNWFNNQVDDQTGNNIDNKKAQEISSYEDLLNELKGIWNKTLVYKFDDNTVFTFIKSMISFK